MPSPKKVFVADDDPTVQDYLKTLLEDWGYEVGSSENGSDALQRITEEGPDLVLMDVILPDMDGITLCRRLKLNPKTSQIPILVLTSLTDSTTSRDAKFFGASDCIGKPFDPKFLKSKIEEAFKK